MHCRLERAPNTKKTKGEKYKVLPTPTSPIATESCETIERVFPRMPRRYPRLQGTDREGQLVTIPLDIAPKLLPDEEFTCPSQTKVNEIAEANERVKRQAVEQESRPPPKPQPRPPPPPSPQRSESSESEVEYRIDENEPEKVGSSITGTASPERSTASSSQGRVKISTNTEIRTPPRRRKRGPRRLWTRQEDEIVVSAVMMNQTGPSLVGKFPNRSRSAVLKRFYVIKDRVNREKRKKDKKETADMSDSAVDSDGEEDREIAEDEDERNSAVHMDKAARKRMEGGKHSDAMEIDVDDSDGEESEATDVVNAVIDKDDEDDKSYVGEDTDTDYEEEEENGDIGNTDEDGVGQEDGFRSDEDVDMSPPI